MFLVRRPKPGKSPEKPPKTRREVKRFTFGAGAHRRSVTGQSVVIRSRRVAKGCSHAARPVYIPSIAARGVSRCRRRCWRCRMLVRAQAIRCPISPRVP